MAEDEDNLTVKLGFEIDKKALQNVEKSLKSLEYKPRTYKLATEQFSKLEKLQERLRKRQEAAAEFLALSPAKRKRINKFLIEQGLYTAESLQKENIGDRYLAYKSLNNDLKTGVLPYNDADLKKEEKKRTEIIKKAQEKQLKQTRQLRVQYFRRALSSLQIWTRGFLGIALARGVYNKSIKTGIESRTLLTRALTSHTSPRKVQQIERFATSLGIEPEQLFNAINTYKMKTRRYRTPDEVLLQELIDKAKSPNADALAAQMNGVDPSVFRALKNYKGKLKLSDNLVLSDEDLAKLEKIGILMKQFGDAIDYLCKKISVWAYDVGKRIVGMFVPIKEFEEEGNKIRQKFLESPKKLATPEEKRHTNLMNKRYRYDRLPSIYEIERISNNFYINSSEPGQVAKEVKDTFTKDMLDMNSFNNQVRPAVVR